jgi:23S rRNA (cytidine1920-2'-O)/16S rRNA (cytidine1409-2'-O)-methyltransferase
MQKLGKPIRIDKLLVERGFASSRERAQALVLAGKVLVEGQKITKTGAAVSRSSELRVLGSELRYVSRGGLKLERALEHWKIKVAGRVALDVGASTGGFTDCLLEHGARRVIAIDTGRGQISFRLRTDPRVCLLENTNARYLERDLLGETVDLIAIDVSFISATLIVPAVVLAGFPEDRQAWNKRELVVLIKPQFELSREEVGKGGIVRQPAAHEKAVVRVLQCVEALGPRKAEVIDSPILGAAGNKEFLLYATF